MWSPVEHMDSLVPHAGVVRYSIGVVGSSFVGFMSASLILVCICLKLTSHF